MFDNLCDQVTIPSNVQLDCATFANGVLTKGVVTTFVYYENLLRESLDAFKRAGAAATCATCGQDSFHLPSIMSSLLSSIGILLRYIVLPTSLAIRQVFYSAADKIVSRYELYDTILMALFAVLSLFIVGLLACNAISIDIKAIY